MSPSLTSILWFLLVLIIVLVLIFKVLPAIIG